MSISHPILRLQQRSPFCWRQQNGRLITKILIRLLILNRFLLLKPKKSKKLVGQAGVCNVYVVHAKRVREGCAQVRNRATIVHQLRFFELWATHLCMAADRLVSSG